MIAAVLASLGLVTLVMLALLFRGTARAESLQELSTLGQAVDLHAFRNLTDPAEEEYLRSNLPAREFRRVQRMRMRAAAEYVKRAAHNASLLIRVGEAARQQSDAAIAEAGEKLANDALRLRTLAVWALGIFYVRMLLPNVDIKVSTLADRYQFLRERANDLGRLVLPSETAQVEAAL